MFHQIWFRVLLIIILSISVYSLMLGSSFRILDDQTSIVTNTSLRDISHLKDIFTQGYFGDHSYYRPVVNLSYMAEYQVVKLNPFFYHLDNLFLHILNAFLVWGLVILITQNTTMGFWVALLFAIHPIHVEAVSSISGRAILMGATFALTAFISFLLYEQRRKIIFLGVSLGALILALLCKESTAILPGVIVLYLWVKQKSVMKVWPFVLVVGLYIIWRSHLGLTETFPWRNITECFLLFTTFLNSLMTDLRLFMAPIDLYFDRSQSMFRSFKDPMLMITLVFWGLITVALWLNRRQIHWMVWFLVGWFLLEMLPVSQLVTTIGVGPGVISCAEHFLYLASIPVFIMMVIGFNQLMQLNQDKQWVNTKLVQVVVGIFVVFLLLINIEQNMYASNELALFKRALSFQPNNARLHSSVGTIYAYGAQFDLAQQEFAQAVQGDSENPRFRIALAQSVCDQGRYQECLNMYNQIENVGIYGQLLKDNKQAAQQLLNQHVQILSR